MNDISANFEVMFPLDWSTTKCCNWLTRLDESLHTEFFGGCVHVAGHYWPLRFWARLEVQRWVRPSRERLFYPMPRRELGSSGASPHLGKA